MELHIDNFRRIPSETVAGINNRKVHLGLEYRGRAWFNQLVLEITGNGFQIDMTLKTCSSFMASGLNSPTFR
jgi:hypothetical protein